MMRPFHKWTSRQDRTKPITPSCREFNSASDGVCFVKQFVSVIVLQHQKENQVQSFTLTNLDRVNHEFELIATYPSYSKVFRAIANKFSSLRTMIFGLKKLATIIHSLNLPETVKTRIWNCINMASSAIPAKIARVGSSKPNKCILNYCLSPINFLPSQGARKN